MNQEVFLSGPREPGAGGPGAGVFGLADRPAPAGQGQDARPASSGGQANTATRPASSGKAASCNLNWLLSGRGPRPARAAPALPGRARASTSRTAKRLVDCLLDYTGSSPANKGKTGASQNNGNTGNSGTTHPNGSADHRRRPARARPCLPESRRGAPRGPLRSLLTNVSGLGAGLHAAQPGPHRPAMGGRGGDCRAAGRGACRARTPFERAARRARMQARRHGGRPAVYRCCRGRRTFEFESATESGHTERWSCLNDPTVRIVSVGQSVDVKRTIEVVARKDSGQPQILQWKED